MSTGLRFALGATVTDGDRLGVVVGSNGAWRSRVHWQDESETFVHNDDLSLVWDDAAPTPNEPWHDAAIDADYWFYQYANATTPFKQADAMVSLANAMSDLRSWLPGYDPETGTLPWEREAD